MKLIYTRLRRPPRRRADASSGFTGQLNFADCAAQLVAARRRWPRRSGSSSPAPRPARCPAAHFGERIGDGEPALRRRRRHLAATSARHRRPADRRTRRSSSSTTASSTRCRPRSPASARAAARSCRSTRAGEIQVGPGSAGAEPGPACYGRGGTEPTMTDAFLLIGILDPGRLRRRRAEPRRRARAAGVRGARTPRSTSASASRTRTGWASTTSPRGSSTSRSRHGVDPRDYSLLAFGAAGPMMLPGAAGRDARRAASSSRRTPACSRRSGLLSQPTWSTPTAAAPTRSSAPTRPAPIDDRLRADGGRACASELGERRARASTFERRFDGRLVGQTWETPFIDVPAGHDRRGRDRDDDRVLPRRLRAAHGQPLRRAARSRA